MTRPLHRLFHAVVVVGASLSGCGQAEPGASGAHEPASTAPSANANAPFTVVPAVSEPADTAREGEADAGTDTRHDARDADAGADVADASVDGAGADVGDAPRPGGRTQPQPRMPPERCPPGSEMPFPPCYYIR